MPSRRKRIKGSKPKPWINPVESGLINFLEYYDQETLDNIVKDLMKEFRNAQQARQPYKERWVENYQIINNYSWYYENSPDWQAAYFIPIGWEIVNTVVPRALAALYDVPPLWTAIPHRPDDQNIRAGKIAEGLLDRRAAQTKLFMTHYQWFFECYTYGTSFMKLRYEVGPDYEGTKWHNKDIFDIYPDMNYADMSKMRYVWDREIMHFDTVKEYEELGVFENVDKIRNKGTGGTLFSQFDRLRNIGIGDSSAPDADKEHHEILERWGRWRDPDTDEVFDVVIVIADRKTMLRFEENPYQLKDKKSELFYALKPYVKLVDVPMPNEVYGKGEIDVIKYLQYEANDRRNMMIDAMQYALSPTFQVLTQGIDEIDKLIIAPGNMIPTNYLGPGVNAIQPIAKDMGFMAGYQDLDQIKTEIRDAVGIHNPMRGDEGKIRKTATEIVSLVQEGNFRIKAKIQVADIDALADQARMTYDMEKQYTDEEILVQVFDPDDAKAFVEIKPMDIKFEGDFRLEASSLYGTKAVVAQQRLQFVELCANTPPFAQMVNWELLLKRTAESLDIRDKNLIMPMPPPQAAAPQAATMPGMPMPQAPPALSLIQGGGMPPPGMPPASTPAADAAAILQSEIQQRIQGGE